MSKATDGRKFKPKNSRERKKAKQVEARSKQAKKKAQEMFLNATEEELEQLNDIIGASVYDMMRAFNDFLMSAEGNMFLLALTKDPDFCEFCKNNYTLQINPETNEKAIIKTNSGESLISYIADVVPNLDGSVTFTLVQTNRELESDE